MESVTNYLWAHVDFGSSQVCARWLFGEGMYKYKHGQQVTWTDNNDLSRTAIRHSVKPIEHTATFRIVDKDYDKGWLASNMSILKSEWERRGLYGK